MGGLLVGQKGMLASLLNYAGGGGFLRLCLEVLFSTKEYR